MIAVLKCTVHVVLQYATDVNNLIIKKLRKIYLMENKYAISLY